jgi:phenylalanyl-tRNA synthetase beta chain
MLISYNWLKEYCHFELPASELAARLSHAGFCVETFEPRGDDWALDVEVTSNRPDCLSHIGLSREISALTGKEVHHPPFEVSEDPSLDFDEMTSVEVHCPELCPHYTARIITDVKVAPSPEWLQQRLEVCGLRPVNNVVDVTNYVLLETGQPLHAFDMNRLAEQKIIVRTAEQNEKIRTIDGSECELSTEMCVIADAEKPVALAGIMGGLESEIGTDTTAILLESARFHPANIRRTSRKLGLSSDSSYRFERGVDPENVDRASLRAARLILELAGGNLATGKGDVRSDSYTASSVTLRLPRMESILGLSVEPETVKQIFKGLEFPIEKESKSDITVTVPSWRQDIEREIDLIEEVARLHGYDKIAETTNIPITPAPLKKDQKCERRTRELLAGTGFNEVISYSLIPPDTLQCAKLWTDRNPIPLRNPVSSDKTHMRITNTANLLRAKHFNLSHGVSNTDLFELGKVYLENPGEEESPAVEKRCLSLLTDREDGFFVLKGILHNILHTLKIKADDIIETPVSVEFAAEPECLRLEIGDELLGYVGILRDNIAREYDFGQRPALMEVDFEMLIELATLEPVLRPIPKFPPVRRDIAIITDEDMPWSTIERTIRDNAPDLLQNIEFFDLYRGKQIPNGKKSLAFSIVLRSPDRTLTGEEADQCRKQILDALVEACNAEPR